MIANITQNSTLKPLILYNENKIKEGTATILEVANVFNDSEKIAEHLFLNLGEVSKRQDKYFHVSLNFPKVDITSLNDETLKKIAKDYMEGLNFHSDHPYIVYKHSDTNHPHLHIVTSKIQSNGKPINDSHLFRRSQSLTRELELKYNLNVVSSEKRIDQKSLVYKTNFDSVKEKMNYFLRQALYRDRVENLQQLKKFLNNQNLDLTVLSGINEVNNKMITYQGLIYHNLTDDFKRNQKGIISSNLRGKPTLSKLNNVFDANIKYHKNRKKYIRNSLGYMLDYYDKLNYESFKEKLNKRGLNLNLKFDSKNNLVGVSFLDIKTNKKYGGEKIGKQFRAQALSKILHSGPNIVKREKSLENELKPIYEAIKTTSFNQQIHLLIALGFQFQIKENEILIKSYKDKDFKRAIIFSKQPNKIDFNAFEKFNKTIIYNPLIKLNHNYFLYNRARLFNDIEKQNFYLNNIYHENKDTRTENSKNIIDKLFNDVFSYVRASDHEDNSLSDIDRKKRKRRKL